MLEVRVHLQDEVGLELPGCVVKAPPVRDAKAFLRASQEVEVEKLPFQLARDFCGSVWRTVVNNQNVELVAKDCAELVQR